MRFRQDRQTVPGNIAPYVALAMAVGPIKSMKLAISSSAFLGCGPGTRASAARNHHQNEGHVRAFQYRIQELHGTGGGST